MIALLFCEQPFSASGHISIPKHGYFERFQWEKTMQTYGHVYQTAVFAYVVDKRENNGITQASP